MSGQAYLGWIGIDGRRQVNVTPLPTVTVEMIVEIMKFENPDATDRMVPLEEVAQWLEQS